MSSLLVNIELVRAMMIIGNVLTLVTSTVTRMDSVNGM
jgi:hypothetical protein